MAPHGGKRKGAGRKASRGATKRAVALLDAKEQAQLERLQEQRGESASDVLRAGLKLLALTALACALGASWPRAQASEDALRRGDVERIVRALENQAQATRELARAVERSR